MDTRRADRPRTGWAAAAALFVAALGAACAASGSPPPEGGPSLVPAETTDGGGAAVSLPDPCALLTATDVNDALAEAGLSAAFGEGQLLSGTPTNPSCVYHESGPAAYLVELGVSDAGTFAWDAARGVASADAVAGVGDDAFFASTCSGPDLLGHDQLFAKAKGLVFHLRFFCHDASTLAPDKSDQAKMELLRLAISRA